MKHVVITEDLLKLLISGKSFEITDPDGGWHVSLEPMSYQSILNMIFDEMPYVTLGDTKFKKGKEQCLG